MKKSEKIIHIILIIILTTIFSSVLYKKNDYNEITQGAYVSSIGISYDIKTKTYEVYFYILNNFNLGNSQYATSEAKNLGYITKGKGTSIASSIHNIKEASNIRLETSHIKSLVLKDTFFNDSNVFELVDFIKNSPDFYPSFIVYTTSDEISEIYKVENFTETSAYYTLLVNNQGINKPKLVTFTYFINDILDENYTTGYPIIKSVKTVLSDYDEPYNTLIIDGMSYITNKTQISFFKYDHLYGLKYFNPLKKEILSYDDFDFLVYEYYYKNFITNNTLNILITIHGKVINNRTNKQNEELFNTLKDKIIDNLNNLKKEMDEYNIDVFNTLHMSKNNNFKDVKLNYKINII